MKVVSSETHFSIDPVDSSTGPIPSIVMLASSETCQFNFVLPATSIDSGSALNSWILGSSLGGIYKNILPIIVPPLESTIIFPVWLPGLIPSTLTLTVTVLESVPLSGETTIQSWSLWTSHSRVPPLSFHIEKVWALVPGTKSKFKGSGSIDNSGDSSDSISITPGNANATIAKPVNAINTTATLFLFQKGTEIGSKLMHFRSSINSSLPLFILNPSLLASYPMLWFKNCWPVVKENEPSLSEVSFIVLSPILKLILASASGWSALSQILPFISISISSIRISDLISDLSISDEIFFFMKPSFCIIKSSVWPVKSSSAVYSYSPCSLEETEAISVPSILSLIFAALTGSRFFEFRIVPKILVFSFISFSCLSSRIFAPHFPQNFSLSRTPSKPHSGHFIYPTSLNS